MQAGLGERGMMALCGIVCLTVSLGAVDWRLAGSVLGVLLLSIALAPLFIARWRRP